MKYRLPVLVILLAAAVAFAGALGPKGPPRRAADLAARR
jgi:hypothetical protein